MPYQNLNTIVVDGKTLADHSTASASTGNFAYFKNLDSHLIDHIQKAPAVVGCVA